jgi:hypothetical protein
MFVLLFLFSKKDREFSSFDNVFIGIKKMFAKDALIFVVEKNQSETSS